MKTPAIIASLTVVGSLAFAAGQGDGRATTDSRNRHGRSSSSSSIVAGNECTQTQDQTWFAPSPRIGSCVSSAGGYEELLYSQNWRIADVNGDGTADHFRTPPGVGVYRYVIFQGQPLPDAGDLAVVRESLNEEQRITLQKIRVFEPNFDLHAWCASNLPAPATGYLSLSLEINNWGGWRDMDADGDLDLLAVASDESTWIRQIWFENIGYEKPAPPIAADINRDGRVDGADLGLVLASWGPNP
jgi:hypothetical protein